MNYLSQTILSEELSPVLFGYSPQADGIARRLFRQYRLISHVFCDRAPLIRRFSPILKFHLFRHAVHDELAITALEDFADNVRNADVILYLIPATRTHARLIARNRDRLETRFVIASSADLRVLLGEQELSPNLQ